MSRTKIFRCFITQRTRWFGPRFTRDSGFPLWKRWRVGHLSSQAIAVRYLKWWVMRRCIYTNYCEGLDQRHKQVTCQLWDRELEACDPGREGVALSSDGKRRLVAPPAPSLAGREGG
jgi:hypothetical protein